MPLDCATLTVAKKTNIIAIELTLDKNICDELCEVAATITWKNTGKSGSFNPAIMVNGTSTGATDNNNEPIIITLDKDQTHTQIFNLTGLAEGTYVICPDPNP